MRWFGDVLSTGPLRGGFLGIGGSGANTDRGQNLASTQGSWNIFNSGLSTGTAEEGAGQQSLGQAQKTLQAPADYWNKLLTGGRTQYEQMSAPAINSTLAGSDATRSAGAQFGSGRSGATVAANRDASTGTQSAIDNIVNQNTVAGRQAGATGLNQVAGEQTAIGGLELSNALANLGLSQSAIQDIMKNSSTNYQFDTKQGEAAGASAGQAVSQLAPLVAGWFGL